MKKVLLAGESWMSYTTHVKGFDSFYTSVYETGEKWLKKALEENGYSSLADRTMTGTARFVCRISSRSVSPDIPGSIKSKSTKSGSS